MGATRTQVRQINALIGGMTRKQLEEYTLQQWKKHKSQDEYRRCMQTQIHRQAADIEQLMPQVEQLRADVTARASIEQTLRQELAAAESSLHKLRSNHSELQDAFRTIVDKLSACTRQLEQPRDTLVCFALKHILSIAAAMEDKNARGGNH